MTSAPLPLILREFFILAVLTTNTLLSICSNSLRLLLVCMKQSLALLSVIISMVSWVCVLHFAQFAEQEFVLLQTNSNLLSRLLKLINSCDFLSSESVHVGRLVDTDLW